MTDDPFDNAEPHVISVAEGEMGTCPCGWQSAHLFPGRPAAQQDLDTHLRTAHPDRFADR